MPRIFHVANPYAPMDDIDATHVAPGTTVASHLSTRFPGFTEFPTPTICVRNGKPMMRDSWGKIELEPQDLVVFMPAVGASVVIAIVIAVAVAILIYLMLQDPVAPGTGSPQADPVYSLKGQNNQNRKGESIERHYGHVRHWPSLASRPYNQYIGDDQYLYLLFCIGAGRYHVDAIFVDDTPIVDIGGVEYEVIQPGAPVTLFPTFVETSVEVAGVDLVAPNEAGHDWSGWYIITSAGERTHKIELDVSFRQGCYKNNSKGKPEGTTVQVTFEYQKVDNAGDPVGGGSNLYLYNRKLNSTKAKRFTFAVNVTPARYRVRAKRTNDHDFGNEARIRDLITWEGVRAFNLTTQNFGNVTLLAVRAQATGNLNDQSRNRFNARIRAITPVWNGTSWVNTDTRSPVWAAVDVLRAEYGKQIPDRFINLPAMVALADELNSEGVYFDWSFDQRGTIWPAIQACLTVARAKPVIPGAVISVVRDKVKDIPTMGFNSHNIKRDTFKVSTKMPVFGDTDGIEVEYINPDSWQRETVVCLIDNDVGNNPKQIRLAGCTSRNAAYRWGLATRATEKDQITNITLTTGIEGGTALFGDLVVVQHDLLPVPYVVPNDQSGRLQPGAFNLVGGDTEVTLPKLPVFLPDLTHRLSLRDRFGAIRGPYVVTPQTESNPYTVVIGSVLDLAQFEVSEFAEQATYFFGATGKEMMYCKVAKIVPAQDQEVQLTLVPYSDRVYTYGSAIAPALGLAPVVLTLPRFPAVSGLVVYPIPDNISEVVVTWLAAPGAVYYIIETSLDGDNYDYVDRETFTSYRLPVNDPGTLWIRVAAVNEGAGPYAYWDGSVGVATSAPAPVVGLELEEDFIGTELKLTWASSPIAESYKVRFYLGVALLGEKVVNTNRITYNVLTAKADAVVASLTLSREITVEVIATNVVGDSDASTPLVCDNPLPTVLSGLVGVVLSTSGGSTTVQMSWEQTLDLDIESYMLYAGYATGFTPGLSNLRYTGPSNIFPFVADNSNTNLFWVVAAKDRWGVDINLTAQQSIAL